MLKRFQQNGPASIRHKARGRRSNDGVDPGIWDYAIALVRESYIEFRPTLAAEMLEERHDLKVSRETLRRAENLRRASITEPDRLRDILSLRDERYVSKQLAFSYERKRIIL